MSLLDHPEAQALLNDAARHSRHRPGCADRLTELPPALSAPVLSRRAAAQRHPGHPRPAQRPGAQDLRADRHRGRAAPQADPVLRRRGQVGRRGRDGRVAAARPRGTGRARRRRGHRPQRLPQEGDRVLRGRPPVVRPAGQGGQLPGRRLPGLRRAGRLRPAGPPALPAQGLGRRQGPPREMPRPPGDQVPGEVADRAGPAGPEPARLAPRLDRRR